MVSMRRDMRRTPKRTTPSPLKPPMPRAAKNTTRKRAQDGGWKRLQLRAASNVLPEQKSRPLIHHRSHTPVGIEWPCSFDSFKGSLHENTFLAARSNHRSDFLFADPHTGNCAGSGRHFFSPRASCGEKSSEDHGDQRPHSAGQLLLAAGQKESGSGSLSGGRERLHRCGDEADRSTAKKAV